MKYLNVPISVFSSPQYIGAEPVQRATWISLLAWCSEQENGGRITGCRQWGNRRWMQTCGIMQDEVENTCELYVWDGDDLMIHGYPQEVEQQVKRKRNASRENGKLGGRPAAKTPHRKPDVKPGQNPEDKPGSPLETQAEPKPKPSGNLEHEPGYFPETQTKPKPKPSENRKEVSKKESKELRKEGSNVATGHAPYPECSDEVEKWLELEVARARLRVPRDRIGYYAGLFYNDMKSRDWIDRHGDPVKDWKAAAIGFAMRCTDRDLKPPVPPPSGRVRTDSEGINITRE